MEEFTHFGFRKVPKEEKARLVHRVFDSVADRYDLMNDLMSLGIHRLWKRVAVHLSQVKAGEVVLDLAGGTGDLAALLRPRVGQRGRVVLSDINWEMLSRGRDRLLDEGWVSGIDYLLADAQKLPLRENLFDCVTIGFGLRNVTDQKAALREIYRVLKPGGRLLVLEFSRPIDPLFRKLYDLYSFKVLPTLGELVAGDRESYQYLAESIRVHPPQQELKAMMEEVGFEDVEFFNLTLGVVAIHRGYKY